MTTDTDPRAAALLRAAADYYAAVAEVEARATRHQDDATSEEAAGRIALASWHAGVAQGCRYALAVFRDRLGGLPRD